MGSFVLFTIFLRQKGSPESKKLEGKEPVDADPRGSRRRKAPWPVRRGGLALAFYEHSLTIALFLFFFASLFLHAAGGVSEYNSEQLAHGAQTVSLLGYMGNVTLLVRVVPELAERVHGRRRAGSCCRSSCDSGARRSPSPRPSSPAAGGRPRQMKPEEAYPPISVA